MFILCRWAYKGFGIWETEEDSSKDPNKFRRAYQKEEDRLTGRGLSSGETLIRGKRDHPQSYLAL